MSSSELNLTQLLAKVPFNSDEINIIRSHLFDNIATKDNVFSKVEGNHVMGSLSGAIIASPMLPGANFSQDYFFHWVRDAAITMLTVIDLYEHAESDSEKERLHSYLRQYLEWAEMAQSQPSVHGISVFGEPKYNIDGTVWMGEWSRPQNDGPALRAIAATKIANILLDEGQTDYVTEHLYKIHPENGNSGVVKNDLNYIANHWGEKCSGLWEEVVGYHFFTEMVQRRALIIGADLAKRLNDATTANFYLQQVKHISLLIKDHWDPNIGYYSETLKQHAYKGGGINSSIILGIMYGKYDVEDMIYPIDGERLISSAYYIRYAFEGLYLINHELQEKNLGPLIGRYPTDLYDGNQSTYGNPWLLTTAVFASYYYALAYSLLHKKSIEISFIKKIFFQQINPKLILEKGQHITIEKNKDLFTRLIVELIIAGDKMLGAVKYCGVTYEDDSSLHLSEQIDRTSGKQVSAKDLTWSYSTVLSALRERELLVNQIKQSSL